MQFYVLGPAFGLPSIDAECAAAATLLQFHLEEEWEIIPTHDQTRHLPYLVDGGEIVSGFEDIARHLEKQGYVASNTLSAEQRADSTAVTSYIETHAQTLLDISMYVSFENYSSTRTAFTKILPWHANYIIPPTRRAEARRRTEHLGLSSIDLDDVHEDLSNRSAAGFDVGAKQTFEAETQKRASLLLPGRNTVRSLLQRPEHAAVFKLHALADNFFTPLQEMLGDKEYFLDTSVPTNVDCFAYGYLSLMLYPRMPQDWLAKVMRKKYDTLVQFTERMHTKLKMYTDVEDAMSLAQCKSSGEIAALRHACGMNLPWAPPAVSGMLDVTSTVIRDLISRVPMIGTSTTIIPIAPIKRTFWQTYLPAMLGVAATSIGLFGYYAFTTGRLVWPHGEEMHIFGRKRFADYGHLGAALAGVSLLGQHAAGNMAYHQEQPVSNPLGMEVDVEKDRSP